MRRWFPLAAALVLLAALWLPVQAAGTIPDSALERLRAAITTTDCTQADCAPGIRTIGTGRAFTPADGVSNSITDYGGSTGSLTYVFNGTTWDRARSMSAASTNSQGNVGFTGVALALADGANFRVASSISNQADGVAGTLDQSVAERIYNGSTWDRKRGSTVGTGIDVAAPPDYAYKHIAAGQATTVVKNAAGFLHAVCFNSAATAANVTTIYDDPATVGTVFAIPNAVAATVPNCITYDAKLGSGITIITGTANGSDMTVSYR